MLTQRQQQPSMQFLHFRQLHGFVGFMKRFMVFMDLLRRLWFQSASLLFMELNVKKMTLMLRALPIVTYP